jgi:uncharacterized phage infection (PIP) family protein YhgE
MTSDIDDIDQPVDDDEDLLDDEPLEELEPTPEQLVETAVPPEPGLGQVESIQDLLAKQETASQQAEAATEEDVEDASAALNRDERLEPLDTRIVPMQSSEFMCKRCFLVKHRSQLADKKRTLCRDCA